MATVDVHEGRPVMVRRGGDELRAEAATLERLAGPGVPQVIALEADGAGVRLVTSLSPRCRRVDRAVIADVAAVLARAHGAGITHGPLLDEHLGGAPGHVVVSGWATAGAGDPRSDVASFGRLVERHAGADRSLRALAARAAAPDPPTMAALAATLADAGPRPDRRRRRPVVRPRQKALTTASAFAVALAGAGLALGVGSRRPAGPGTTGTPATRARRPATSEPVMARQPVRAPDTTTTTAWLAHRVEVAGNVVERDGRRWSVGRPGDIVVVGDWDCDGVATIAVVRPGTGEVWAFTDWSPAPARPLATVPRATSAEARSDGRCDRLAVVDGAGQTTVVG